MEKIKTETDLINFEKELKYNGYQKAISYIDNSDFYYYKSFSKYQVFVRFYDFRKIHHLEGCVNLKEFGVDFKCLINNEEIIELIINKDINFKQFEEIAKRFYELMIDYV